MKNRNLIIFLCVVIIACVVLVGRNTCKNADTIVTKDTTTYENKQPSDKMSANTGDVQGKAIPGARNMAYSLHLVNIHDIDSAILVDLKYATTDNFTGKVLYIDLKDAYLQPDVARMLAEAHRYLKESHPGLRLLIYDAVRPLSVQRAIWEHVKDTKYRRYVADPSHTGLHNYGAAVDLTLADTLQQPLDMGTPFDFFGRAAGISNEQELIEQGLLNEQQLRNRQLLRQVMQRAGFRTVSGEWWHFNACSLQEAKQRYTLVE